MKSLTPLNRAAVLLVLAALCSLEILVAQNVGIGTTTPLATLHIEGLSGGNGLIRLQSTNEDAWIAYRTTNGYVGYSGVFNGLTDMDFGTGSGNINGKVNLVAGGVPKFTMLPSGNVGIGTAMPGSILHLSGSQATLNVDATGASDAELKLTTQGASSGYLHKYNTGRLTLASGGAFNMQFLNSGGGSFTFSEGSSNRMQISAGGNVGIGIEAPTQSLDIAGQVRIRGGAPGAGKVLTSDANGVASWQPGLSKAYFQHFLYFADPFEVPNNIETVANYGSARYNFRITYTNGVITVPDQGLYHFDVTAEIGNSYANEKKLQFRIYINGNLWEQYFSNVISTDLLLNASDQVEFRIFQSTGGSVTLGAFSRIGCHKVN